MLEDIFAGKEKSNLSPEEEEQQREKAIREAMRTGDGYRAKDDYAPLTSFEIEYNRQLTRIDDLLDRLDLEA